MISPKNFPDNTMLPVPHWERRHFFAINPLLEFHYINLPRALRQLCVFLLFPVPIFPLLVLHQIGFWAQNLALCDNTTLFYLYLKETIAQSSSQNCIPKLGLKLAASKTLFIITCITPLLLHHKALSLTTIYIEVVHSWKFIILIWKGFLSIMCVSTDSGSYLLFLFSF